MSEYTTSILPQNATLRQDTCSPRNQLIPVIKLTEPVTYSPWEYIPCTAIVVRMQDILKHNGKNFNFVLEEIRNMGSVNKFLGCEYPVILSTIMRDKTLFGCDVEKYIEAIRVLKPKYFMTLDGETYEEEAHLGAAEIERTLRESREVICKCRDATPIGLVKGANARQIEEHSMALSQLGLRSMVFHTGDFLRQDSDYLVGKAKLYARLIRKNSDYLLLYGIGSPKNFRRFYFADSFITQGHYVNGFYGQSLCSDTWRPNHEVVSRKTIMTNLVELNRVLGELGLQRLDGGLTTWVEDFEGVGLHMRQIGPEMPDLAPRIPLGI